MTRRAWRVLAAAGLVAGAFVVVATPAAASQFSVTTAADAGAGSLRQAVLDANANAGPDTIAFDPSINGQTITLTSGELVVNDALTVTGNGATNTIIDGNASNRMFNITGAGAFAITGATLQHGVVPSGDGGAILSDGPVTVDATTITDNSASGGGGGVDAVDVTIQHGSVVRANEADNEAGGALATTGDMTVTDSTIGGSSVSDGNTATNRVGGVGSDSNVGGAVTITSSTVSHNTANDGGGVVSLGALTVTSSTVSSNDGGGVAGLGALTITDSAISSNTGTTAGGGALGDAAATISGSWFDQNTATIAGGGLANASADATTSISDSTFSNNRQTDASGPGGGGIGLVDVNATITNVTISGNSSAGTLGGGGIAILNQGNSPSPDSVTIGSSTLDGNSGGGIVVAENAPTTSVGSTILSNTTGPACGGTITDAGFNLLFNTDSGPCVFDAANDATGADPELSALTLNAPATLVPTMVLSATSPALDVVTTGCPPPATDERGVTRPQGDACDVGAFELVPAAPPTTTTVAVAPAGADESPGGSGILPVTGGPGPGLALLGFTLLVIGALVELASGRFSGIHPHSKV